MEFALAGVLCGCFGVVAVLMAAGGLLRLAIYVANRLVRPTRADAVKPARRGGIAEWDWDEWDDEGEVSDEPDRPWRAPRAIPEPGTLRSMAIVLGTGCAFTIGFIATAAMASEMGFRMWREETKLAVALLNLPVAALALTLLLTWTLGTRFWRAAMVTFVYGLVLLAFVLFIGSVVLFVARAR